MLPIDSQSRSQEHHCGAAKGGQRPRMEVKNEVLPCMENKSQEENVYILHWHAAKPVVAVCCNLKAGGLPVLGVLFVKRFGKC